MSMKSCSLTTFLIAVVFGVAAQGAPASAGDKREAASRQLFTFVQLCDTQLGMGGYEHDVKAFEQAVKQINVLKPDFVLICGDLVGKFTEKSVEDFKRIKAGFTMPCHCVPGNHDVGNKPTLESLRYYREMLGEDYYAFEHKGYSFACVNTSLWKAPVPEESEKHNAWFEATLAEASKRGSPVFVVGHYPVFNKTPDEAEGYYNLPLERREKLLALFDAHGVVAVLTGHAHRIIINEYKGIQLVTGEATSRTNGSPLGFRLWHVEGPGPFTHESVPLDDF